MTQQEKQEVKDLYRINTCDYGLNLTESAIDAFAENILQKLDELRKPSEPETNVGEAVEELSKRIKAILDTTFTNSADFSRVSTEIAALMQTDKELLEEMYEALVIARDRIGVSTGYPREIAIAISNYEKQSK
jgi:hypothetical protein